MKKVLGIDVDLTVVDTLHPWLWWYYEESGIELTDEDIKGKNYNIETLMAGVKEPLKFWEIEDLYDELSPEPDAKKYIDKLSEEFEIVFVSSVFNKHIESKEKFLKRFFPYAGFIATHSKKYIDVDYFIDDHKKYIDEVYEYAKNRGRKVKCLKVKTILSDGLTWDEIYEEIKG